jgi:hypothetical protein
MVQRCGCYADAPAILSCIRLLQVAIRPAVPPLPSHLPLQLRLPSLKALAVPTPSDVPAGADTALLVQVPSQQQPLSVCLSVCVCVVQDSSCLQLSGVFPVAGGGRHPKTLPYSHPQHRPHPHHNPPPHHHHHHPHHHPVEFALFAQLQSAMLHCRLYWPQSLTLPQATVCSSCCCHPPTPSNRPSSSSCL